MRVTHPRIDYQSASHITTVVYFRRVHRAQIDVYVTIVLRQFPHQANDAKDIRWKIHPVTPIKINIFKNLVLIH